MTTEHTEATDQNGIGTPVEPTVFRSRLVVPAVSLLEEAPGAEAMKASLALGVGCGCRQFGDEQLLIVV